MEGPYTLRRSVSAEGMVLHETKNTAFVSAPETL